MAFILSRDHHPLTRSFLPFHCFEFTVDEAGETLSPVASWHVLKFYRCFLTNFPWSIQYSFITPHENRLCNQRSLIWIRFQSEWLRLKYKTPLSQLLCCIRELLSHIVSTEFWASSYLSAKEMSCLFYVGRSSQTQNQIKACRNSLIADGHFERPWASVVEVLQYLCHRKSRSSPSSPAVAILILSHSFCAIWQWIVFRHNTAL